MKGHAMKMWAVWESEYPEGGSSLYEAWTAKGAKRRYRKDTDERVPRGELTPLDAFAMTSAMLEQRLLLNGAE